MKLKWLVKHGITIHIQYGPIPRGEGAGDPLYRAGSRQKGRLPAGGPLTDGSRGAAPSNPKLASDKRAGCEEGEERGDKQNFHFFLKNVYFEIY